MTARIVKELDNDKRKIVAATTTSWLGLIFVGATTA